MQKDAVFQAVQNGIMIITGGPGTGKTTTDKYDYPDNGE